MNALIIILVLVILWGIWPQMGVPVSLSSEMSALSATVAKVKAWIADVTAKVEASLSSHGIDKANAVNLVNELENAMKDAGARVEAALAAATAPPPQA